MSDFEVKDIHSWKQFGHVTEIPDALDGLRVELPHASVRRGDAQGADHRECRQSFHMCAFNMYGSRSQRAPGVRADARQRRGEA
jgi:hypothetical protein